MSTLTDKIALVTGASTGLGAAINDRLRRAALQIRHPRPLRANLRWEHDLGSWECPMRLFVYAL